MSIFDGHGKIEDKYLNGLIYFNNILITHISEKDFLENNFVLEKMCFISKIL